MKNQTDAGRPPPAVADGRAPRGKGARQERLARALKRNLQRRKALVEADKTKDTGR